MIDVTNKSLYFMVLAFVDKIIRCDHANESGRVLNTFLWCFSSFQSLHTEMRFELLFNQFQS